jgi:hypothetical protein
MIQIRKGMATTTGIFSGFTLLISFQKTKTFHMTPYTEYMLEPILALRFKSGPRRLMIHTDNIKLQTARWSHTSCD